MGRRIRFGGSMNSAKSFEAVIKDLERIAREKEVSIIEVIDYFLMDLRNLKNENHEKKLNEIEIKGEVSYELIKELTDYLNKTKRRYSQIEKRNANKEKRQDRISGNKAKKQELEIRFREIETIIDESIFKGEIEQEVIKTILEDVNNGSYNLDTKGKKYIIQRLQERLAQAKEKEKELAKEQARQAENQRKVEETWESIQEVAKREIKKRDIKESQYWRAIRKKFVQQSEGTKSDDVKKQILQLIDDTIIEKEDDEYFEEVKSITRDFKSLASFSVEMMNAMYGTSTTKITSRNMDRFLNLKSELQKTNNEYQQIKRLLNNKYTTQGDKRILLARKEVMDKEFEKKRKEEGR